MFVSGFNALSVAVGSSHTCAIFSPSPNTHSIQINVMCWGHNDMGQLGLGVRLGFQSLPGLVEQSSGLFLLYHTIVKLSNDVKLWHP